MTTTSHRPNSDDAVIHSPPVAEIGNVASVPADPLLTPPDGTAPTDQGGEVVFNGTLAALRTGARCITVIHGHAWLTPVEAARLGRQLIDMAKVAADERTLRGYDE